MRIEAGHGWNEAPDGVPVGRRAVFRGEQQLIGFSAAEAGKLSIDAFPHATGRVRGEAAEVERGRFGLQLFQSQGKNGRPPPEDLLPVAPRQFRNGFAGSSSVKSPRKKRIALSGSSV